MSMMSEEKIEQAEKAAEKPAGGQEKAISGDSSEVACSPERQDLGMAGAACDQRREQRVENPEVGGSNPPPLTRLKEGDRVQLKDPGTRRQVGSVAGIVIGFDWTLVLVRWDSPVTIHDDHELEKVG